MIQIFHPTKENRNNLNKAILQLLLISYLYHITDTYKSNYNKRKNQVILLIINDESNKCYYFAVKNLSELNSLAKKETVINGDTDFEDVLDDVLDYQTIEAHPERISKLKPYINKYNWEGIEFPARPKDWKKFDRNNKTITLNVLYVQYNTKTISVANRSEYNNKCKKQVILSLISNGKNSIILL